ncbi:hypothetical protein BOC40_07135 [Burkholderia pseudomallei]|nr:hypothetical protein BOC40_07135 [Burkholderia pseudomallei]
MSAARGPAGRRAAGRPCRPRALPASRTRRTACATSRRIRHGASAPVGPSADRRARVRPAARLRRRVTRPARASACA